MNLSLEEELIPSFIIKKVIIKRNEIDGKFVSLADKNVQEIKEYFNRLPRRSKKQTMSFMGSSTIENQENLVYKFFKDKKDIEKDQIASLNIFFRETFYEDIKTLNFLREKYNNLKKMITDDAIKSIDYQIISIFGKLELKIDNGMYKHIFEPSFSCQEIQDTINQFKKIDTVFSVDEKQYIPIGKLRNEPGVYDGVSNYLSDKLELPIVTLAKMLLLMFEYENAESLCQRDDKYKNIKTDLENNDKYKNSKFTKEEYQEVVYDVIDSELFNLFESLHPWDFSEEYQSRYNKESADKIIGSRSKSKLNEENKNRIYNTINKREYPDKAHFIVEKFQKLIVLFICLQQIDEMSKDERAKKYEKGNVVASEKQSALTALEWCKKHNKLSDEDKNLISDKDKSFYDEMAKKAKLEKLIAKLLEGNLLGKQTVFQLKDKEYNYTLYALGHGLFSKNSDFDNRGGYEWSAYKSYLNYFAQCFIFSREHYGSYNVVWNITGYTDKIKSEKNETIKSKFIAVKEDLKEMTVSQMIEKADLEEDLKNISHVRYAISRYKSLKNPREHEKERLRVYEEALQQLKKKKKKNK